jgi:hypothetical protein
VCYFPQNINSDDKYDAIWFAGCNQLHAIFRNPDDSIHKIKEVLKDNGFIVFTETPNFVKKYCAEKYNLTVPITSLGANSIKLTGETDMINDLVALCQLNFEEIIINNHMVYTIKTHGGKRYKKLRKSRKLRKLRKLRKSRKLRKRL